MSKQEMVILRVEKHKVSSLGSTFRRLGGHHDRSQLVANAVQDRIPDNIYEGPKSGDLMAAWEAQIKQRYTMPRSVPVNAVGVVELLLTFSPEAALRITAEQWHEECKAWIGEKFGAQNILMNVTHKDETTPHYHVFLVPITPRGGLSAREMIGGPSGLKKLQTAFAEDVGKRHGLERGRRGSKAKHVPPAVWRQKEQRAAQERIEALETETVEIQQRTDAVIAAKEAAREQTERLRGVPLVRVMELLGYPQPDRTEGDERIYATEKGHVSINPAKGVYALDWDKGGKGPFDLIGAVSDLGFQEAKSWLAAQLGEDTFQATVVADAVEKAKDEAATTPKMTFPEQVDRFAREDERKREKARNYLTEQRGIAPEIVEATSAQWFATEKGGVAFRHLDGSGRYAGLTIRGMYSGFKMCLGDKKNAFFRVAGSEKEGVGIVESPIDALAYRQITGRAALSVAGCSIPPAVLSMPAIRIALDADSAGQHGANEAKKARPDAPRDMPADGAKDWAEGLLVILAREAGAAAEAAAKRIAVEAAEAERKRIAEAADAERIAMADLLAAGQAAALEVDRREAKKVAEAKRVRRPVQLDAAVAARLNAEIFEEEKRKNQEKERLENEYHRAADRAHRAADGADRALDGGPRAGESRSQSAGRRAGIIAVTFGLISRFVGQRRLDLNRGFSRKKISNHDDTGTGGKRREAEQNKRERRHDPAHIGERSARRDRSETERGGLISRALGWARKKLDERPSAVCAREQAEAAEQAEREAAEAAARLAARRAETEAALAEIEADVDRSASALRREMDHLAAMAGGLAELDGRRSEREQAERRGEVAERLPAAEVAARRSEQERAAAAAKRAAAQAAEDAEVERQRADRRSMAEDPVVEDEGESEDGGVKV